MMPIGYKMRDRSMMAMATVVVHLEEVVLEVVVMVAWLAEDAVRWCVIIVTRLDIWLATVETKLRHVGIAEQLIMSLSNARS